MRDKTRDKSLRGLLLLAAALWLVMALLSAGCAPPEPKSVKLKTVKDDGYDPAKWGKVYPAEYQSWLQTKEPRPVGKSMYKPGWTTDRVVYDKLSEFPYMALLFNGWGFGIEYNEPRGHYYMLIDQQEVDPARVKAGGACLTCKTPYAEKLAKEGGKEFFKMPYLDAVNKIPKEHRTLGVACIDCHDHKTMALKVSRWTIEQGLKDLEKAGLTNREMRSVVCAQCHVSYIVTKDDEMKSTNVVFPWKGSTWGEISIENIIKQINSDPHNLEWTQSITGFKVGFIRHPEFELYSRNSVHWKAGVACADCHMPYKRDETSGFKITDHNIMSPLKNDMKACLPCHVETAAELRAQVITIQDRTVSLMLRSGYQTAVAAKLFELANKEQAAGKVMDKALYDQAKSYYLEAFYRTVFLGAENSVGFHNPTEAARIAGDAIAYAGKSESLLRQMLTKAGVDVPADLNLELSKYLNDRGSKKLNFRSDQEFKDPFGIEDTILPEKAKGL